MDTIWGEVALALGVDAIALHGTVLRNGQKESVESVEAVGLRRSQPSATHATCPGRVVSSSVVAEPRPRVNRDKGTHRGEQWIPTT